MDYTFNKFSFSFCLPFFFLFILLCDTKDSVSFCSMQLMVALLLFPYPSLFSFNNYQILSVSVSSAASYWYTFIFVVGILLIFTGLVTTFIQARFNFWVYLMVTSAQNSSFYSQCCSIIGKEASLNLSLPSSIDNALPNSGWNGCHLFIQ